MEPSKILKIRQRLNETQAAFGSRFNVSQITIGYWESGRSKPGKSRLIKLEELFRQNPSTQGELPSFRPIQYLGSKQKLTETISKIVDEITTPEGRVCDLFSGSGVVSYKLGEKRPITSVDIQQYACTLSKAFLIGSSKSFAAFSNDIFIEKVQESIESISLLIHPLLEFESEALDLAKANKPEQLAEIVEFGSLQALEQLQSNYHPAKLLKLQKKVLLAIEKSIFSRGDLTATKNFGGAYFSYAQSVALDALAINILKEEREIVRDCGMAVLLSATSEIVNTVGKQFAQPMKLIKADGSIPKILLQRAIRDRSMDTLETFLAWVEKWRFHSPLGGAHHRVECKDVFDYLATKTECETFYADPPYTIDHYSRFYHVLETLIKRDSPALDSMNKGGTKTIMRGLYRGDRHQSAFGVPSEAEAAFSRLFREISSNGANLILSYSPFNEADGGRPRLLTLNKLISSAKKYFRKVEVHEITEHSHRKLNNKTVNGSIRADAERLLICKV